MKGGCTFSTLKETNLSKQTLMLGINIDFATLSIRIWRPLRSQMEVGMFGKNEIFSGKGRGMTYDLMAHWIGKLIAKRKKKKNRKMVLHIAQK